MSVFFFKFVFADLRYDFLLFFLSEKCSCGKSHDIPLPKVIVKSGAILELKEIIAEYDGKKPFVLADVNTYASAGKSVCDILEEVLGISPSRVYVKYMGYADWGWNNTNF